MLFRLDEALVEGNVEQATYQDIRERRLGQIADLQDRLVKTRRELEEGRSGEL